MLKLPVLAPGPPFTIPSVPNVIVEEVKESLPCAASVPVIGSANRATGNAKATAKARSGLYIILNLRGKDVSSMELTSITSRDAGIAPKRRPPRCRFLQLRSNQLHRMKLTLLPCNSLHEFTQKVEKLYPFPRSDNRFLSYPGKKRTTLTRPPRITNNQRPARSSHLPLKQQQLRAERWPHRSHHAVTTRASRPVQ